MKGALAAGAFPLLPSCFSVKSYLANSKVRLACCGIGNMGGEDVRHFFATGLCDIVALCDVDLGAKHTLQSLKQRHWGLWGKDMGSLGTRHQGFRIFIETSDDWEAGNYKYMCAIKEL